MLINRPTFTTIKVFKHHLQLQRFCPYILLSVNMSPAHISSPEIISIRFVLDKQMSFTQTLTDVVNGAKKLEDFTNIIVSSAVEDVLLRVSRDYGLDFTKLVNDYKDDVLDKHALLGSGGTKCKGFTATNKPCGRKAVCRGYCRGHVEQGVAKQALDNKGVHYSTTTIKKGADEAILNVLENKLGANVSVENHMVSKSDTFTVV